jgi:hypothetical protein
MMDLRNCPAFIVSSDLHVNSFGNKYAFIKGTMPRDGYFLESLNILTSNTTFCVCANGFQGLSKAFHYPIELLTF